MNKAGVLVDQVIINKDQPDEYTVPTSTGLKEIVRDTYCQSESAIQGQTEEEKTIGRTLRQQAASHQWDISAAEMKQAIDQLSWKKALGADGMPDTYFHDMVKEDSESQEDLKWITERIQHLINSPYWPKYLFAARPILLSKDGLTSTTKKNTRILSVLPAVAKLVERVILNRLMPRLYGDDGLIPAT